MADEKKSQADLQTDIERLRDDVTRLTETVSTLLGQEAEDLRETVRARAEELRRTGRSYARRARDEASAFEAQAEEMIVRNPVTTILVAAGLGFMFGLMSRGK